MKKMILMFLILGMVAGALPAYALPEEAVVLEWPYIPLVIVSPQDDGNLLVSGMRYFPETQRYNRFAFGGGPVDALLNEGYLALLDSSGEVKWELGFGEPTAHNAASALGLLPDGRLLAQLYMYETTMGSQHFMVNMENGRIEDMLPTVELALQVLPLTLTLARDGYIGGGYMPVDDTFEREQNEDPRYAHRDGMTVRYLEWDLTERWSLDVSEYTRYPEYSKLPLANGDVLLCGAATPRTDYDERAVSILRVDGETGEVLWHYTEEASMNHGAIRGLREREDGTLQYCTMDIPEGAVGEDGATWIVTLSAEGERIDCWPVDTMGRRMGYYSTFASFGDGYVFVGTDWDSNERLLVHTDAKGVPVATLPLESPDEGSIVGSCCFEVSPNGEFVCFSGLLYEGNGSGQPKGTFYLPITEETFR